MDEKYSQLSVKFCLDVHDKFFIGEEVDDDTKRKQKLWV